MITLHELQHKICSWADKTFGNQPQHARVKKLANEVEELTKSPFKKSEVCDCFVVLLQVAKGAGMSADELMNGTLEKHRINELRQWEEQPDGTHQHL